MYRDRRRLEPMSFGGARVYVGDIGNRVGRIDLQREFEQYGQVLDIWMTAPQNDGRLQQDNRFAFVVFRYPEDADIAVRDKNGRHICGRKVRVEHAKPPKSQMNQGHDYHRGRGGYWPRGRGRDGFNRGGRYYNNMASRQPPPRQNSRYRSRSYSPRERSYYRFSGDHARNRQPLYEREQYHESNRRSTNYYSPDRQMKRLASSSPEYKERKREKWSKEHSHSASVTPPRLTQEPNSDSYASKSPPAPKKSKKKKKKRARSRSSSESPPSSLERKPSRHSQQQQQLPPKQQEYSSTEEGEYGKPAKSHKNKKSKSSKKKKRRELESGENCSSDESD